MTSLPQVRDTEDEALAYAKQRLVEYRVGFSREAGRAFARSMLKDYALSHQFGMSNVKHAARSGGEDAHLALIDLITEFNARGQLLPPQLADYNIDAHNPHLPPRPPGPRKADHLVRNLLFVLLIADLADMFGLHWVRNRQSKSPKPHTRSPVAASDTNFSLPF